RTRFNRCGYLVHDVLTPTHLDLPRLLTGSEGTLALFTEAWLRTVAVPEGRSVVLFGFASLDTALQAAQKTLAGDPAACELIDRRLLSLARGSDSDRFSDLLPHPFEAVLLVEYEAETAGEARRLAEALVQRLYRMERLALHAVTAIESEQLDRL